MAEQCLYCGNNRVSHPAAKIVSVASDIFDPIERSFAPTRIFRNAASALQGSLSSFIRTLDAAGAVAFVNDLPPNPSGCAGVLWEEAARRGITMENVRMFNLPTDSYRAKVRNKNIYFVSLPRPYKTTSGSEWWLDDKLELKKVLSAAGIPVPRGSGFSRFEPMRKYFAQLSKPAIVKPRLGSRGRHTTTHIYTEEDLRRAFDIAKQISRTVVLEEHLHGSVYRATVIGGELVGVLEGMPPRVTGSGVHTIAQLVERKNETRHVKVSPVSLGEIHREFLARTGRTFDTVLPQGETVDLIEKIGVSYGGSSRELIEITHPETKRILTEAARVVDDPIIGFDFIIPDITASPHSQKWGIIECNSRPFINLHHDPVEGTPVNAAKHLWDYIETHIDEF
jgi:cyanophycin synthetase